MNECPFCINEDNDRVIGGIIGKVIAIKDNYPVTKDHLLIIPTRHTKDYFDLTLEEKYHIDITITTLKKYLIDQDQSITGFNIGVNCGKSAGQTIEHVHIHLIPRRDGDCEDPTGGVRGVIPKKQNYKTGK
jgi:diadenosine tetraphosphate (Ap4A) HIT family hydrolase